MITKTTDTYYFAKALLYAKLSRDYFDYLITETNASFGAKNLLKQYIGRIEYINRDITQRINNPEFKIMYMKDMDDAGAIDSIANCYILLDAENRSALEKYAEELIKKQSNKLEKENNV
jgi:hypothetical protein